MTSKTFFTLNFILFGALISGIMLFAAVTIVLQMDGVTSHSFDDETTSLLKFLVPGIFLLTYSVGRVIVTKRYETLIKLHDLKPKMSGFQINQIIHYGTIEAPALFAAICYFLISEFIFLIFLFGCIAVFFLHIPTKANAIKLLQLNPSEIQQLDDPNAIIANS